MAIAEIIIFMCVFWIARYFWIHRRFYYLAWKIPMSTFDFSLRGLRDLVTADTVKMHRLVTENFNNKSDLTKTWLGPILFVITKNPEDVKTVFNAKGCYDKPYFIKFTQLQKGSLFGNIEYWRSHRKIMNPYFGVNGLKSVVPIFNEKTKIMMKNAGKYEGKGEFDVFHIMTALTLETILNVMDFKVDIQHQEEKSRDAFIKNLENYAKIAALRIFKFWHHPDIIFKNLKSYKQMQESLANSGIIFADDIIANVREKMNDSNNNNTTCEKSKNFMEALLSPKNNFTDDEIRDEVNSLLLAAQDTSAIASSTTLLLLAMHKDIQQKVVDELHQVLGKTLDAPYIDFEKLNRLEYLNNVINEVLRLIPVVPYVFRRVDEEIVSNDGFIIPINTNIIVPIIKIHQNKALWGDDADQFRPERFEKERFQKIHQYAFIPFTKGPRMCLGYKYAMYLMKIQLANFLMKYEVDTKLSLGELEFGNQVTMTACQGYKISIKERCLVHLRN